MVDCHPIMYDSTKEDAFIVHLPHKQVQFTWENGLYVYRPPYVKQPTIKDDKVKFWLKFSSLKLWIKQEVLYHTSIRVSQASLQTILFSWISIHQ
jgi:hypothetical protein